MAGIICFAAVKIKVDGYQTDVVVSNISQQLETEDVVLALAPAIYENEMGNIPYVEWWFDEDENKYYLFVPQFLQNGYQTVWILKNTESIWIGNEEIHNGEFVLDISDIDFSSYEDIHPAIQLYKEGTGTPTVDIEAVYLK